MNNYAFEHQNKAFTPDGLAEISDVQKHNEQVQAEELEWLKTGPDKVFLYVKSAGTHRASFSRSGRSGERNQSFGPYQVHTWLGTVLDANAQIGREVYSNFDYWTHKRSVRCQIFGIQYYGWFYESSGDYCRLRKAKRQTNKQTNANN